MNGKKNFKWSDWKKDSGFSQTSKKSDDPNAAALKRCLKSFRTKPPVRGKATTTKRIILDENSIPGQSVINLKVTETMHLGQLNQDAEKNKKARFGNKLVDLTQEISSSFPPSSSSESIASNESESQESQQSPALSQDLQNSSTSNLTGEKLDKLSALFFELFSKGNEDLPLDDLFNFQLPPPSSTD